MSVAKWFMVASVSLLLVACDDGPAENAGEQIDDAVNKAADAIDDTTSTD